MCGIAGIIGFRNHPIERRQVEAFLSSIAHRGPDDQGVLTFGPAGLRKGRGSEVGRDASVLLVHRRLSIIDLTDSGWQPMSSEDEKVHLVYNGEIYNYLELREELAAKGHSFKSKSDTEVLLRAYLEWGDDCFRRFTGMFAVAILDLNRQEVLLARDFFGIKPLYYAANEDRVAFASEIKALLDAGEARASVNPERVYYYLRFGVTDFGAETLFAGVLQVPAGHLLRVSLQGRNEPQVCRYWRMPSETIEIGFDEAARQLRERFLRNVELHMRSDVRIGAALSGGIDSSSIVCAMRHVGGRAVDLHAFSFIADDGKISEERWIDIVGKSTGAKVHKIYPSHDELREDVSSLVRVQDEPFGSTSIYAQYCVFREAARKGVKVMLDGQGADELLGGYRPFLGARLASCALNGRWTEFVKLVDSVGRLPGPGGGRVRLLLSALSYTLPSSVQAVVRKTLGRDLVPSWLNQRWFEEREVVPRAVTSIGMSRNVFKTALSKSLNEVSLPHLLRYEDRNSMAFSIESRVPFLTPDFAEFIYALPDRFLIGSDGTTKNVFRAAMRGLVPDEVLDRRDKLGFVTPEESWMRQLTPWVDSIVNSELMREMTFLNHDQVLEEWKAVMEGKRRFGSHLWRWVNLHAWVERFDVSLAGAEYEVSPAH